MKIKITLSILLFAIAGYMFIFTAPTTLWQIGLFIFLISSSVLMGSSVMIPRVYAYLAACASSLFFLINYVAGFQLLHNLLLLSAIIGIVLLLRQRHE